MIDFISQTKLPGVIIAKALIDKFNMDTLIAHDGALQQKLKEIGYVIKLSKDTQTALTDSLKSELDNAKKIKAIAEYKAEVISNVLTSIFKKIAFKSKFDTEIIYTLAQVLFIWDEFIDFDDFQKSGNNPEKIRESIFYRAATQVMKEMNKEEVDKLSCLNIRTYQFQEALNRLQVVNGKNRLENDQYQVLIAAFQAVGMAKTDSVFFLLTLESVLFTKIAENFMSKISNTQAGRWREINTVQQGIKLARSQFSLDENKLEDELAKEAETLLLQISIDIFS